VTSVTAKMPGTFYTRKKWWIILAVVTAFGYYAGREWQKIFPRKGALA
jgi:hypothetical protein